MDRIIFCLFLQKDIDIYLKQLPKYFPPMQDEKAEGEISQDVFSNELGEILTHSTRSVEEKASLGSIEKTTDSPEENQVKKILAKVTDASPSEETLETPLGDAPVPVVVVDDSPVEDKEPKEKESAAKDKKAEEKKYSKDNTRSLPK